MMRNVRYHYHMVSQTYQIKLKQSIPPNKSANADKAPLWEVAWQKQHLYRGSYSYQWTWQLVLSDFEAQGTFLKRQVRWQLLLDHRMVPKIAAWLSLRISTSSSLE